MSDLCYLCDEPLPGVQHTIFWDHVNRRAAHPRCRMWEQYLEKRPVLRRILRFRLEGVGL